MRNYETQLQVVEYKAILTLIQQAGTTDRLAELGDLADYKARAGSINSEQLDALLEAIRDRQEVLAATPFPERIKEARKAAGLTQQAMADRMEIPRRTIQEWEGGRMTPPPYVQRLVLNELEDRK